MLNVIKNIENSDISLDNEDYLEFEKGLYIDLYFVHHLMGKV